MSGMKTMLLCQIAFMLASCLPCRGQDYTIDSQLGFSTGPAVGQAVPMFTLPDQNGRMVSLKDLVGENGAILNFFRSASW